MPHYYQTGTANNVHDLINYIEQFLTVPVENGYTLIGSNDAEIGGGYTYRSRYFESTEGEFFGLSTQATNPNTMWITHIGYYNPYAVFYAQPGTDGLYARCNYLTGPFVAYHLFRGVEGARGRYFHCCVEYQAGSFSHFGFGEIDAIGNRNVRYTNGLDWESNPDTTHGIRAWDSGNHNRPFDGLNNSSTWASYSHGWGGLHINYNTPQRGEVGFNPSVNETYYWGDSVGTKGSSAGGYGGDGHYQRPGLNGELFEDCPSELWTRTPLLPCHCVFDDTSHTNGGGYYGSRIFRIVGIAPAFRMVHMKYLNPGDIVDNNWKVFPLKSKTSTTGPYSGDAGIAYRFQ